MIGKAHHKRLLEDKCRIYGSTHKEKTFASLASQPLAERTNWENCELKIEESLSSSFLSPYRVAVFCYHQDCDLYNKVSR